MIGPVLGHTIPFTRLVARVGRGFTLSASVVSESWKICSFNQLLFGKKTGLERAVEIEPSWET